MSEEDKEKEFTAQIEAGAEIIDKIQGESDDYFEKNLTYISAGTLVLSLTFVEKIVNLKQSSDVGYLIASWIFMALTLGINLSSHLLTSYYSSLTTRAMRLKQFNGLRENMDRRNARIRAINAFTACSLIIGMITLIIFCSINAITMSKQNSPINKAVVNNPSLEQKGKTIIVPSSVLQQPKPASTTVSQQANGNTQNVKTK